MNNVYFVQLLFTLHIFKMINSQIQVKGTLFTSESNDRMRQLPEGSLLIKAVTRTDAGEYSCSVENSFGQDSVTHQLVVLGKEQENLCCFIYLNIICVHKFVKR